MSGILLPGQDKQPDDENKIELPKGFSSSRRRTEPEAPATEAPDESKPDAAPTEEEPTAPERRARRPVASAEELLENLKYPPRGAQIACPSCGHQYVVPVFSIIDLGENPELRQPLLSGQINVAVCPTCGAGGALGAPLMVHIPEENFLGVYAPAESGRDDMERQRAIGDLTQTLMRNLPAEQKKGYVFQPKQFMDWQRFLEKLWEFEGVTPEMLRRQRDQSALLQRLIGLVNDDKALELALERNDNLIDREFFSLLEQIMLMTRAQGQQGQGAALQTVRSKLLDKTDVGREVRKQQEKVRSIIAKITPNTSRDELLDIIVNAWQEEDGQQIVGTLAVAAAGLFDYQFLMALSQKIDAAASDEERATLSELRQFLLEMQEQISAQQRQSQESAMQQAQQILQEVLQSQDARATLAKFADAIDETFLQLLAANIQSAERSKATAAVRRLRTVYQQALEMLQDKLPPDMKLLNQLLSAQDQATTRQLLRENRSLLNRDFVESLKALETDMRDSDRTDVADRIKSLRGQIALML